LSKLHLAKFASFFVTVYSSAPVFVDVADELISEVSALKTEQATLKTGNGKSLTLYTS